MWNYIKVVAVYSVIIGTVFGVSSWEKTTFPNPISDPERCGQNGRASWICDPDNCLTSSEVRILNNTATRVRAFKCPCTYRLSSCGYKMSIAVVPAILVNGRCISTSDDTDKLKATKDFALYLSTYSWDFGQCDDDLVVVLAVKERKVWTHLGTKMRDVVSAECVNKIFQDNKQLFSILQYGEGLIKLFDAYRSLIMEGEDGYDCKGSLTVGAIVRIVLGSIFGFGILIGCVYCCATGKCEGGQGGGHGSGGGFGGGFGGGGDGGGGDGGGGDF